MSIHIGHHFFGAGNVGDDLMLAGFLRTVPERYHGRLTCCVPHNRSALAVRFPEICWLPYDPANRAEAISRCEAWLGLGGSPFQCTVSRWFVDHLVEEARFCAGAKKPMYFLGVGGQDPAAYGLPEIRSVCAAATAIWTRDPATAAHLTSSGIAKRVTVAADLAHILFAARPPPPAMPGRISVALNFDYSEWPALPDLFRGLDEVAADDWVWAAQEARELPGAERWLHARLPAADRQKWRLQVLERPLVQMAVDEWPTAERQVSSRYHTTLVSAWAGSKTVVIATNDKLRAAAQEYGFPVIEMGEGANRTAIAQQAGRLPALFRQAMPPSPARLRHLADLASQACAEFFASVG